MNPEQVQSNIKMPDLQKVNDVATDVKKTLSNSVGDIGSQVGNIGNSIGKTMDQFSATSVADASSEFLEANTLTAKFAFVAIILIAFLFLMRLGMIVLSYIFSPSKSPYLVKGVMSGNSAKQIKQDPRTNNTTVYLSENETSGLEMTYSVWLYLDGVKDTTTLSHIFNKGSIDTSTDFGKIGSDTKPISGSTLNQTYNAPGLYVLKNIEGGNNLRVYMDSYVESGPPFGNLSSQVKSVDITGVPIKKWFNTIIRVENRVLDLYVNGVLTKRMDLESIPRHNFADVYVCQNGGFQGNLSDLRYFNKALNVFEINGIVGAGPNTSTVADENAAPSNPHYLSTNWYSSNT
uniref:LamG-like jellyroll fold domain-containing protein n=1 Tax=viral metagenome TaxID=1070528 RepID=A0A6C0B5W1_9ZZZZ